MKKTLRLVGIGFILIGVLLVTLALVRGELGLPLGLSTAPMPMLTPTLQPIVPTARPPATPTPTSFPTATHLGAVTPTLTDWVGADAATTMASSTPTPAPTSTPPPATEAPLLVQGDRWRVGISIPVGSPLDYDLDALGVGWVMNWHAYAAPPVPPGVEFAQMVRMKGGQLSHDAATLTAIAAANPGALWLISNEPDVKWQDNVTPETYARLYHTAYHAIKAGDAGAVIVAGGIAQPTPLRLRYLDRVRETYQAEFGAPLPVDAWQIHNYMLREELDSWGVDIPPGFDETTGMLYTVDDSGNLELFKRQIYDFRRWMVARGYQGLPLLVTEFGIPMPADYGFPPERVADYLRETWRFFATATDGGIGNPNDGGRLVQRWCWYSLADPIYSTGNLIYLETGLWTSLGETWLENMDIQ